MGCVIALDDFGTGYSSLAYLARLPVDVLKMDREFVADIERDPRGAALVASVVDLGRTLGMDVVAEGVETPGSSPHCRHGLPLHPGVAARAARCRSASSPVIDGFDPAVLDARSRRHGNGPASPLVGRGWLTSAAARAHSVRVPAAACSSPAAPAAS